MNKTPLAKRSNQKEKIVNKCKYGKDHVRKIIPQFVLLCGGRSVRTASAEPEISD